MTGNKKIIKTKRSKSLQPKNAEYEQKTNYK